MSIISKDKWDRLTFTEREKWLMSIGYNYSHSYNNKRHLYCNLSLHIRSKLEVDIKKELKLIFIGGIK